MFTFTIEGGLTQPRREPTDDDAVQQTQPSLSAPPADATFGELLQASPMLYPIAVDPRRDGVQFVSLTQAAYDAASFLDSRMLAPGSASAWVRWSDVRRVAAGFGARCHFIFHISHVGSTLLSRLVGQHPAFFSLREPAILRTLADAHVCLGRPDHPWTQAEFDDRLAIYLGLWSRTFDRKQTAVIKATSFVCEMSELLMERTSASRSVFMYVSASTFLKALLDGAMTDIDRHAATRLDRLHRRLGTQHWRLTDLSAGEAVAMSWLAEMSALHSTNERFADRVLWIDFDRFLDAPESSLVATLKHFGATDDPEAAKRILAGPTMGQYAKAPAYKYDANMREQLLRQGEERHAAEIRKGLAWLERAAAMSPAVDAVIRSAERRSKLG